MFFGFLFTDLITFLATFLADAVAADPHRKTSGRPLANFHQAQKTDPAPRWARREEEVRGLAGTGSITTSVSPVGQSGLATSAAIRLLVEKVGSCCWVAPQRLLGGLLAVLIGNKERPAAAILSRQ